MSLWGTMLVMDKPETYHQLVGQIARLEVDATLGNVAEAERRHHIPRSVLYRIFEGNQRVTPTQHRKFERAFGFPPFLFKYMIEGNTEWVGEQTEIDAGVKQLILAGMEEIATAQSKAAATRRSRRHA